MPNLTVILDRKELVVRMEDDILRVDQPACNPEKIPLNLVREVIVIGSPMISCGVWRALAARNIPAVLLSARGKQEAAYLGAGLSVNTVNRIQQYETCRDNETALRIGKWVVEKKLKGQEEILREMDKAQGAFAFCSQIRTICNDLEKAGTAEELMGYEGAAAAAYFRGISTVLAEKWKFSSRNRRPPLDPVNSLLSLTYVIASAEILRTVQQRGLDPCIGFFHALQPGRHSFVLDILEPIRPELDRFVFSLLDNPLTPADFRTSAADGCRLTQKGRKIYYSAWAAWKSRDEDGQADLADMVTDTVRAVVRHMGGEEGKT
ncbi:MAG: CRISPR-associated endonuclease Cas1 [Desulfobacterales bacterium]